MEQPANRKLMEMIRSAGMPMESIVSLIRHELEDSEAAQHDRCSVHSGQLYGSHNSVRFSGTVVVGDDRNGSVV